ncbi:MAG: hypothetical protein ACYSUD_06470, partial [Planctomycetota bacterium]
KVTTMGFTPDRILSVSAEDISIRSDTASFLSSESPRDKLRSCPDDLKSTDFILLYLYQINCLPVKKNHWIT